MRLPSREGGIGTDLGRRQVSTRIQDLSKALSYLFSPNQPTVSQGDITGAFAQKRMAVELLGDGRILDLTVGEVLE